MVVIHFPPGDLNDYKASNSSTKMRNTFVVEFVYDEDEYLLPWCPFNKIAFKKLERAV